MKLHESLADLARDHGHDLFRDAAAFRGSLDDYLDEGQASSGTINLLTDAVRLGALDGMLTMLDSGANPADAVESAGQRLARDRGSADVRGCQWAVAVLGFALGKVPEGLVTGLDPEAGTTAPPSHGPGGTAPTPPMTPPLQSPVQSFQQPIVSPPHQPMSTPTHAVYQQSGGAGYGAPTPSYPGAGGGWSQPAPPQKKSKTGLIIAATVVALVVIIGGIVGLVLVANGGDDDKKAGGDGSNSASQGGSPSGSESVDSVPDIGGPQIEGLGYTVQAPKGWTDGTEEFIASNPGLTTLDKVILWGSTFNTARGNVIVETQSSYGSTDPNDLKDAWKDALISSDSSAEINDIANISIDGQTALGVEILRTNENDVTVRQRAHLVISGDKGYSITVSLKDGDDDVFDKFDEILSTWRWTS
ncbi:MULTISPECIES: hypothetical protein [unclassified Nocardioides]|uniref:hypothetical protein n=1 Tax=unclassified Nocardioides TaxID=2615069 RepID=UPI0006FAC6A8|nr:MULTISPECIES: hypothetical protein [unclassified Nocardioides]KRA38131.1 hypothetical protein ASD81_05590 [Nocardioides sp. Root614]KRA92091.1 hypothetical protein ASD84_05855 [Nocardioides sp. Root682]